MIIAVVIVLSLVVVGLVVGVFSSPSQQISTSGNNLGLSSQAIGITESLIEPNDGNFVIRLLNNSGENLTVSNVSVGDVNVSFSEDLAQGVERFFVVDTDEVCSLGKIVSEDVVVTYVTRDGLTKVERYPLKVMFSCTPYVVNATLLANQCPSCADLDPMYYGFGTQQTTCYNEGGYQRSCSGTGEEGEIYGSSYAHGWVDNGDGTVSDTTSGLMWQKADNGSTVTWQTALTYCNDLSLAGHSDWHLPTLGEIWQMRDYENGFCQSVFASCNYYWSSTSLPAHPYFAYFLYAVNGSISTGSKDYDSLYRARCVRFEN